VFGLGGASTAAIKVTWPNGTIQNYLDAQSLPGFPNVTVTYSMDPEIDPASVDHIYTPSSGSTIHEYTWWTQHAGGNPEVLVMIASPATTACKSILGGGTQKLLKAGVGGVSVESVPLNGGFEHRLEWTVTCEAQCNYTYAVRNELSGAIYSDGGHTMTVSVCGGFGW